MEEDKEKKVEGYTKIKHELWWNCDLSMEERYMVMFLLDCENYFNKQNDWFNLTDDDFIKMGFGKNKVVLRKTRNSLIERGWISFKRGIAGKKSSYKLNRKKKT